MNKLTTTLFVIALAVSTSSYAQWTQYRDANGQPAGTSYSSTSETGLTTTQYRDATGAPAGSTISSSGTTQAYGRNGAPAGTASGDRYSSPVIVPSSVYVPYGSTR